MEKKENSWPQEEHPEQIRGRNVRLGDRGCRPRRVSPGETPPHPPGQGIREWPLGLGGGVLWGRRWGTGRRSDCRGLAGRLTTWECAPGISGWL